MILIRNEKAKELVSIVEDTGDIEIETIDKKLLVPMFKVMRKYKKIGAQIRIEKLKKNHLPYPNYHYNLPDPKYADLIEEIFQGMGRGLGKTQKGRNLGSFIAFSKIGDKLTTARILRRKFLRRYQYKK